MSSESASLHSPEATSIQVRARAANPASPSADQLSTQRAAHWHQDGKPLLTVEDLRGWLQRSGLVLYGPKPQLGAPAPTLVEATLGKAAAAPELGELDAAKSLLTRVIAEGSAVPLNLLGVTGGTGTDVPDFVVSAAVFSYIFTLRGNKAWKQMPVTSGPVKVSPLALAAYEMLTAKVTMSAYDLTTQLGKEVTEAAVLRALTELWGQMRVLPMPQVDGSATMWELASGRFTKQIKAGANAGQPSALSALISLYLGQAVAATEDEIESFLSPLAPRSRVRDVIHALLSARQLETLVIDGKTLLHVGGELPAFAAGAVPREDAAIAEVEGDGSGSRITKFAAKPGSKIGTGLRARPAPGGKPTFGRKPAFDRGAEGGDRERRPFKRAERPGSASSGPAKPTFDKPWQEKRPARPAADGDARPRPAFGASREASGEDRPPRREFPARAPRDGEAPRRTFSKPGTFGRKRESGGERAGERIGGGDRERAANPGARRDFAASGERAGRPSRPTEGGSKRPGSYTPRPAGPRGEGAGRPGFARDRSTQGGPARDGASRGGASRDGAEGGEAPKKVFRKFDAPRAPKPFGSKPAFGPRSGASGPRPFAGGDRSERPSRAAGAGGSRSDERPRSQDGPRGEGRPSYGAKASGFGAKKPFGRSEGKTSGGFAGKGGPFAKFADGKKPFRKPGPPKKAAGGGFSPTRRKRDEGGK